MTRQLNIISEEERAQGALEDHLAGGGDEPMEQVVTAQKPIFIPAGTFYSPNEYQQAYGSFRENLIKQMAEHRGSQ